MKKILIVLVTVLTLSSTAFAQIGSPAADLVFTPITPCRIVDTRTSQGGTGPIATDTVKTFNVYGVSSYAAQGGSATNCGLLTPGANVAAVAVSMAVVFPVGQGFLTAFPGDIADAAKPLAATLNYNAGEVVVSNAAILKVSQVGNPNLKVFASNTTEVIIDVVGYYSKPVATALNCTTVSGAATTVAAGAYTSLPTLFCATGFTPISMSISAGENVLVADSYTVGNAGQIFVRSLSVNAQGVTAKLQCCQIPGR
jgi:hypothetical protein